MTSRTLPSRVTPQSRSGRVRDEDSGPRALRAPLPSGPRLAVPQASRTPDRSQPPRGRPGEGRTVSSTSSSSGSSSFLDRMKIRSEEASSRTSLEDDYEEPPRRPGGGWASAKSRRPMRAHEEKFDEEDGYQDSDHGEERAGYGYDLWGRVTAVASNLTVNVSKAWEKGLGTVDGEDTPPGQESRLTKAMKAYHLDRAKTPADLPAWLFDERERGAAPKPWSVSKDTEYEERFLPDSKSGQGSTLRDIYDKAAASASNSPRRAPEPSGAANRLKAMREAKRPAMQRQPETESKISAVSDRRKELRPNDAGRSVPRVGLPSGPGRIRHA